MGTSPAFAIGAHLTRALLAGLFGGILGSLLVVTGFVILTALAPGSTGADAQILPVLAMGMMFVLTFSLFFTLPSALLLAAPLTWPFRSWIAHNPWPAALVYGAIGAVAGWAVIRLTNGETIDPTAAFGAGYGAATALSLVFILRKTRGWGDLERAA